MNVWNNMMAHEVTYIQQRLTKMERWLEYNMIDPTTSMRALIRRDQEHLFDQIRGLRNGTRLFTLDELKVLKGNVDNVFGG